jgi:lipid A 3-O-deacylase
LRAVYILVIGGLLAGNASAQSFDRNDASSREVELITENDYIFFEDYYYTAGQDALYRRLVSPESRIFGLFAHPHNDSAKVIVEYRAGLKIFNPFNIKTSQVGDMDRPYAGWTFAGIAISNFNTVHSGNRYQLETGVVGKASGMEQLQMWVHKITAYDLPRGWDYQIRNELVTNLYYTRFQDWRLTEGADIVTESRIQAGTGVNGFSQDVTLRLMQFNPINNSAFTNSRLNWAAPPKKSKDEIFAFIGLGGDYVLSNIFMEGSLFSHHKSVFEVRANPWVFRRNVGVTYSNTIVSWSVIFNHLSREISKGRTHSYVSLRLGVRF